MRFCSDRGASKKNMKISRSLMAFFLILRMRFQGMPWSWSNENKMRKSWNILLNLTLFGFVDFALVDMVIGARPHFSISERVGVQNADQGGEEELKESASHH